MKMAEMLICSLHVGAILLAFPFVERSIDDSLNVPGWHHWRL